MEPGQIKGPAGLPAVQLVRLAEVLQVLVVSPNVDVVWRALEVVTPIGERADDSEEFLIVDLVVPLSFGERLRKEGDGVPNTGGILLREDGAGGEIRGVGLETEGFRVIGHEEYGLGGEQMPEAVESYLTSRCPDKLKALLREVVQRPSDSGEVPDEPSVVIGEAQEGLDVLHGGGDRPFGNATKLHRIHPERILGDDDRRPCSRITNTYIIKGQLFTILRITVGRS